jgi:type II secretory pathway component PulF
MDLREAHSVKDMKLRIMLDWVPDWFLLLLGIIMVIIGAYLWYWQKKNPKRKVPILMSPVRGTYTFLLCGSLLIIAVLFRLLS